jgi:hypothetical protein
LLEGQHIEQPESWKNNATLNFQSVTPGYFEAVRLRLTRGRTFSDRDQTNTTPVAIVSERTANRLWPGQDPIGQRVSVAAGVTEAGEFPMQTVVGVVADARYRGIDDVRFDLYMPATQTRHRVKHLMVRTASDPHDIARSVQAAAGVGTTAALVEHVDTLERIATEAMAPWRFSMTLMVVLAGLGVALAITGLFALIAYTVAERRAELAVRLAIGAAPQDLFRMVVWHGAKFAAVGLAIGLGVSLLLADRLSPLLFQLPARDPVTFVGSAAMLGAVVIVASAWAARRVMAIDPSRAIRTE